METVIEPHYADPSYNGHVVAESIELATVLDQYGMNGGHRMRRSLNATRPVPKIPRPSGSGRISAPMTPASCNDMRGQQVQH
jgi:hypothetical protein